MKEATFKLNSKQPLIFICCVSLKNAIVYLFAICVGYGSTWKKVLVSFVTWNKGQKSKDRSQDTLVTTDSFFNVSYQRRRRKLGMRACRGSFLPDDRRRIPASVRCWPPCLIYQLSWKKLILKMWPEIKIFHVIFKFPESGVKIIVDLCTNAWCSVCLWYQRSMVKLEGDTPSINMKPFQPIVKYKKTWFEAIVLHVRFLLPSH